jgi:hypothetical protein
MHVAQLIEEIHNHPKNQHAINISFPSSSHRAIPVARRMPMNNIKPVKH